MTPSQILLLALATESLLAILAVALAWMLGIDLEWGPPLPGAAIGVVGAAVLAVLNFVLITHAPANWLVDGVRAVYHELLIPLFGRLGPASIVAIGALAGLGEELLFRGVMQPMVGIVAASVAFGLVHVGGRRMVAFGIWAAAMGLVLGWLLQISGGLTAPIVAHGLYDVLALFYIRRKK
jgi:membrane protease YdiL (CAAX protease family)